MSVLIAAMGIALVIVSVDLIMFKKMNQREGS